ncbi:MAG TPA: hypothetical protein VMV93_12430 [Chloroflexota bacterium]|nr:hypothetical protein [Chloroflexota bacterium]
MPDFGANGNGHSPYSEQVAPKPAPRPVDSQTHDHGRLGYAMGLGFIFLAFMSLFLCGLVASAVLHFMR